MDLIKIIKEKIKINFSEGLINNIILGLFVGVTIASLLGTFIRIFEVNLLILIVLLYLYPMTGLLTAYIITRNTRKRLRFLFERGYHG
jgi:hypothetical protein